MNLFPRVDRQRPPRTETGGHNFWVDGHFGPCPERGPLGIGDQKSVLDVDNWLTRANEILQQSISTATAGEKIAFATSFIAAFYGPESVEMKVFRQSIDNIERGKEAVPHRLELHARGTIKAVKAAVESGLIKSVRTILVRSWPEFREDRN